MNTLKSSLLKRGKKGFTLTELAIVIAVIAILIAVLVPTFTSVINNARRTTAAETASHALTEYTIETSSSVPDGSIVINGDYSWTIKNGSFEVSENGNAKVTIENKVQYSWGKDADAGITEVDLYIPTTGISQSIAKVVAQNYVNSLADSSSVKYIGVEYVEDDGSGADAGSKFALTTVVLTDGETSTGNTESGETGGEGTGTTSGDEDTTTYYYFEVTNGAVTYDGKTAPSSDSYDSSTTDYAGVIIFTEKSGS